MTKSALITQTSTKLATAAALGEAKARRKWSNSDAADALGCGEGTIRNRLEGDDPKNQMTVHELRRSLAADGTHIANRILADDGYRVVSAGCDSAPDALAIAAAQTRCATDLIEAAPDGFDPGEAERLLPGIVAQIDRLSALEGHLRRVISEARQR